MELLSRPTIPAFVNNVIIECDMETASFIASVNGTFRYFVSVVCRFEFVNLI
jgi:hypothetical protein